VTFGAYRQRFLAYEIEFSGSDAILQWLWRMQVGPWLDFLPPFDPPVAMVGVGWI